MTGCEPLGNNVSNSKRGRDMPFDALMVSIGVSGIFVVFAAVLAWADSQTKPSATNPEGPRQTQPEF